MTPSESASLLGNKEWEHLLNLLSMVDKNSPALEEFARFLAMLDQVLDRPHAIGRLRATFRSGIEAAFLHSKSYKEGLDRYQREISGTLKQGKRKTEKIQIRS
jgi:hypothetical protein